MTKQLHFLRVDLNGANKMDFSELEKPRPESFCITQEMLDSCDINCGSVTLDTISFKKIPNNEQVPENHISLLNPTNSEKRQNTSKAPASSEITTSKDNKESAIKSRNEAANQTNTGPEVSTFNSGINNRCEDTIFGELVTALLKKMEPDEKKRAKKEIMNILL